MVLSVVGATTAFAGSSAAFDSGNVAIQDVTVDQPTTNDEAQYSIDVTVTGDNADQVTVDLDVNDDYAGVTGDPPNVTGLSASDVSVDGADVDSIDTSVGDVGELQIDISNANDYSGDVVTITLDGVTNPATPTDDNPEIGNTAGAAKPDVDVQFTDGGSATTSDTESDVYSIEPSVVVDTSASDFPSVAAYNSEIDVTATLVNQGTSDVTLSEVRFASDGDSAADILNNAADNEVAIASDVGIDAGGSVSLSATINTADTNIYGSLTDGTSTNDIFHGVQIENAYEGGAAVPFRVGTEEEGEISVRTEDVNGDDLDNTTIELYRSSGWTGTPSSSTPIRTIDLGPNDNAHTFSNLAVGPSESSSTDYVIRATKDEFQSETDQVQLFEPDQTGPTRVLTLQSNLAPNVFGIGAWDEDTQTVTGNSSSLFANGEFDNQAQFVVFAQTQSGDEDSQPLIDEEVEVDILVANRSDNPRLQFVTNQSTEETSQYITVTITPDSPVANVDGNSSTGVFSYETFNVTAENASSENVNPLRTEDFFAWTDDIEDDDVDMASELVGVDSSGDNVDITSESSVSGQAEHTPPAAQVSDTALSGPSDIPPLENYGSNESDDEFVNRYGDGPHVEALLGDVFYFVEGDHSTQHQVFDTEDEPIENATVWVAYQAGPQDLETIESFQNAAGESFLVSETNENGLTVIPGVVDNVDYNVYVVEDGYNIYNSSTTEIRSGGTLASDTNLPRDYFVADYEIGNVINDDEGSGEDDVYSHVLREQPLLYDLNVTVADGNGEFVKATEMPDDTTREVRIEVTSGEAGENVEDFTPADNQVLDLELLNDTGIANLADTTVTTDSNGVATTQIDSVVRQTGVVNISAETQNADGDVFRTDEPTDEINERRDQAEVTVFTAANIEGDVVDANDEDVPGAEVELFVYNTTSGAYETTGRSTVTTSTGSFSFTDVPTGLDYRVEATAEIDGQTYTGFNQGQLTNLPPGTTTAGITLSELALDGTNPCDFSGVVQDYDSDDNCEIGIGELNDAAQDFVTGGLTIGELNQVAQAFVSA